MPDRRTTAAGLRRRAAGQAVQVTARLSRRLGLGGGSVIGGRVGLAIDPGLLASAGAGRRVALVSGTNGKTTTTRLLSAALGRARGAEGAVATSSAGANMPAGLVSALLAAPSATLAALEVDEGYLGAAVDALAPEAVVLLNLSRDQLDRVSEVRRIAGRWRDLLASTDALVVANADDPLVVWAASAARRTRYVAAGARWRSDAYHCPACDARLRFDGADAAGWSCACGLRRPPAWLVLDGDALVVPGGEPVPLGLSLPGRFNQANAALAAAAAEALGVPLADAVVAMRAVTDVAGRFASFPLGPATVRLLLAKNPAGFDELLALVGEADHPVVLAVNARDADGHDPSWLWDVPFERLAGRRVVASGERRLDLAVRLRHAGVDHEVDADALGAVARLVPGGAGGGGTRAGGGQPGGAPVDVIANYTAFQQLRRRLAPQPSRPASPASPAATPAPPARPPEAAAAPPAATRRRPRDGALRIVVVHPDLLGTYGDGGNGLVLANRARWRGLSAELVLAPSDEPLPEGGDLYCLGGGEDGPQSRSAEVLAGGALERAVAGGATVLAVCAGFQILGTSFPAADGRRRAGLGILDVDTERGHGRRAVGELLVAPPAHAPDGTGLPGWLAGLDPLTGFENHAGRTVLGSGATPLGRVLHGTGNDGHHDGAVQGRVVATYLHGPVLARNPQLADALLALALGGPLPPLADEEEEALRAERLGAIASPRRPFARIG